MTQDRNTVEVDVHVKVTLPGSSLPGGAPPVIGVKEKQFDDGDITLTFPSADSSGHYTFQAWTDPSTSISYICAKGQVSAQAGCVAAEVYSASAMCPSSQPTTQDPGIRAAPVFQGGGGNYCWQFTRLGQSSSCAGNLLPLPFSPGSGGTSYQLEVWTIFNDGTIHSKTFSIVAMPANHTDCDNPMAPGPLTKSTGCCGEANPPADVNPALVGVLRDKTGRFSALPEYAAFVWDGGQGGWVWIPHQAHCGTFTLLPVKNGFVLHSTIADPSNVSPAPGGHARPLQLRFEVDVPSADGAGKDRLVLEFREGG